MNSLSVLTYVIFCCLQTTFNVPPGNDPLALDMGAMGKGMVWINGQSIGRHWPGYIGNGNCGGCNYAGTYTEKKCRTYCGKPSQRWWEQCFLFFLVIIYLSILNNDNEDVTLRYHVPRSWLKPSGNLLVVFEEWGGEPHWISLLKRTT